MSQLQKTLVVSVTVNGRKYKRQVEARLTAADFLREVLGLRGTRLGCEQGVCGACTILLDDVSVRACILLAGQLDGRSVTTVEGLSSDPDSLHPIQEGFRRCHGLQCGFCTAGFLMTIFEFLKETRDPPDDEIREAISGNLCRCTGYQGIIDAVRDADRTWDR
jgi:aerobic carbon-monoxide dehydrogenase small subunit